MIRDVHPDLDFITHPGSRGQKVTGSRIRIRNTDSQSSFLNNQFSIYDRWRGKCKREKNEHKDRVVNPGKKKCPDRRRITVFGSRLRKESKILRKCREDEKGRKIWAVSNLRNCSLLVHVRVPFQGSVALNVTNIIVQYSLFSSETTPILRARVGVISLDIKSTGIRHVIHTHWYMMSWYNAVLGTLEEEKKKCQKGGKEVKM